MTDTGSSTDTGSMTDTTPGPTLSELISSMTQPCYDLCLLGSGCDEPDFADLGACEDSCDSDSGYILGNATDDEAGRACVSALLAVDECVSNLNCADFATWWATFEGTYPCSAEETAVDAACDGQRWYDEF